MSNESDLTKATQKITKAIEDAQKRLGDKLGRQLPYMMTKIKGGK